MTARGLIIAAPRSGSGKTTITLALLAAYRKRGLAIAAAKSGPDYIDPAFHAAATGRPGTNLDSWSMPPALLDQIAAGNARGAELVLVELAMGLFDGVESEPGRTGAAADLAARFALPVLLVLDISGQSQTAAAVARGFQLHDPAVRIAGVVLNQVASDRHRDGAEAAIRKLGLPVLGSFRRMPELRLPERHLGLVQASEHDDLAQRLAQLGALAESQLDLDAIAALAAPWADPGQIDARIAPPGQRIALAQDAAFSFIYPHLLTAWRAQGAEILPFSPLADEAPPPCADCCWLPGGYPELHANLLAAATRFRDGLAHFAQTRFVHGECGGFMVLGAALEDAQGVRHAMTGLLGHISSMKTQRLHLGYRQAVLRGRHALGEEGAVWRGHEFHYAGLTNSGPDEACCDLTDGLGRTLGPAGGRRGLVSGTFFHAIAPQAGF